MTDSASHQAPELDAAQDVGPDPVIGAGLTLFGIFVMGVGGASDAHYVFNVGTLIAVLGAFLFVLFVTLTAMKQRRARASASAPAADDAEPGADPDAGEP